jgi:hypothetical protein
VREGGVGPDGFALRLPFRFCFSPAWFASRIATGIGDAFEIGRGFSDRDSRALELVFGFLLAVALM